MTFSPLLLLVSRFLNFFFFFLRLSIFACDLNVGVGDCSLVPVGDNQDYSRDVPPATAIPLNYEVEKAFGADDGGGGWWRESGGLGESSDHTADVTVCTIDARMVVFNTFPRRQRRRRRLRSC